MKNLLLLLSIVFSSEALAQLPEIRFTNIHACISADTATLIYHAKNVTQVHWSTTGRGHFINDMTSGSDTINYYVFTRDKLDSPYTLKAWAENSRGRAEDMNSLRVYPYPFALFRRDSNVLVNDRVEFIASSGNAQNKNKKYYWTFGDGDSLSTTDTVLYHVYTRPGTFSVNLCAISTYGCKNCITKQVYVNWPQNIENISESDAYSIRSSNARVIISSQTQRTFSCGAYTMDGILVAWSENAKGHILQLPRNGLYVISISDSDGQYRYKVMSL